MLEGGHDFQQVDGGGEFALLEQRLDLLFLFVEFLSLLLQFGVGGRFIRCGHWLVLSLGVQLGFELCVVGGFLFRVEQADLRFVGGILVAEDPV